MRIALTGATGMLGAALLRELLARGHAVVGLARPQPSRTLADGDRLTWLAGDLDDPRALDQLVAGTDAIVHAAYWPPTEPPAPGRSLAEHFVQTNVAGTLRLVERIPATATRQMVFVSSLAVYGSAPGAADGTMPLDEDVPLWPREFYGAHKAALEKMVVAASGTAGINTCVLRIGCVLGRYQDLGRDPLAPMVRDALEHGELRKCFGAHVVTDHDAARLLADTLGDATVAGRVYNTFDRWLDFGELRAPLERLLGRDLRSSAASAPEPRPGLSNARLAARGPTFRTEARVAELLAQLVADMRAARA